MTPDEVAFDSPGSDALVSLSLGVLGTELLLAAFAFTLAWFVSAPMRDTLGLVRSKLRTSDVAWLVVGTLSASHALDAALAASGWADRSVLGEFPQLLSGARGTRLALAALCLGLLPGFAEELLCRGLLQRGLTQRFGASVGIGVAALVFGALHVEPIHAGFAAILGVYLGLAGHWSGSTWVPILCHTANNLGAVLLGAFGDGSLASPASIVLTTPLAVLALFRIGRRHSQAAGKPREIA